MSTDDLWRELREQAVAWDEVRERRLLARIRSAVATGHRRRAARVAALAVSSLLVLAGLAFWWAMAGGGERQPERHDQSPAGEARRETGRKTLVVDDVGTVALFRAAAVVVRHRDAKIVVLAQTGGRARYEVDRIDGREVRIEVGGTTIAVLGTIFSVDVDGDRVDIEVERGRVRVDTGYRAFTLGAGEEVSLIGSEAGSGDSPPRRDPSRDESSPTPPAREASRRPDPDSPSGIGAGEEGGAPIRPGSGETGSPDGQEEVRGQDIDRLFAEVDDARRRGALDEAAALLERMVASHPDDPRTATALFTLGNVERGRGRHTRAAEAYRRCWSADADGPLAEDARAETAASLADAGERERAGELARSYLEDYPEGTHRVRMRRLAR